VNLLDILIIVVLVAAIIRGVELGFVRQLFSATGFFGGLFLGAWAEGHLIHLAHTPNTRALLSIGVIVGSGVVFLALAETLGPKLAEFECNPVLAGPNGLVALDARLILQSAPEVQTPAPATDFTRLFAPLSIAVAGASAEFNADMAAAFAQAVPEPSGGLLLVAALGAMGLGRRRKGRAPR